MHYDGAAATGEARPQLGMWDLSKIERGRISGGSGNAPSDGRPDSEALLEAALAIVAEDGLGGLTLRPLARRLGWSLAGLSRQVGSKDQLLDRLIQEAARADAQTLAPWLRHVESFDMLPLPALMEITEDLLHLRAGPEGRARTHLKCELVQIAAFNPRLRAAVADWIAVDRRFWSALAARCASPPSFDMGFALTCFAIDDGARALTLEHFDDYRWVRREGIRRLWAGLFDGEETPANPLYERALSDVPSESEPPLWIARLLTSERDQSFGNIVASIILDSGMDAITHREVARRAGLPHTSVAYHYPLQDDLVELGMHATVEMVRVGTLAAMEGRYLPPVAGQLGLASFAVAVAAARRPSLRPIVREMRRRRGESLLPWLLKHNPGNPRIDMGNIQAMSSVLIGAIVLARADVRSEVPITEQIFAQLGEWPDILAHIKV